ncbi:tyrosine-type recombinase/integrase [Actinokineospora sp. NBRC 105648]|uniref:tyrosine-type recombinase/integrase n=1 Tax=Actinokineospora sp. NBRC 105648 TaxID=3032206 RepID=UPI0025526A59|nr:tyrosine-type recombinase/integrase [Actinokineospora sp. NBRC 105648]
MVLVATRRAAWLYEPDRQHGSRHWFRKRVWVPAPFTAGITHRVRVHYLRHAHASWLLQGGADLQTVRERLGHASLRAAERYLHTIPNPTDTALDALAHIRTAPNTISQGTRSSSVALSGKLGQRQRRRITSYRRRSTRC